MGLILNSIVRCCALICICFVLAGCSEDVEVRDCDDLRAIVSLSKVQDKLVAWADKYPWSSLADKDYSYGGGVVPGQYRIPDAKFDWNLLKMDKKLAQIRVITSSTLEIKPVLSISFSEYSRRSVLIKNKNSDTFGIKDKEHLYMISERVAVYCMENQ